MDPSDNPTQRVLDEFLNRRRSGEHLDTATLVVEHPDLSDDLEDSFRTLAAIEQSGGKESVTGTWPLGSSTQKNAATGQANPDDEAAVQPLSPERRLRFEVMRCLGTGGFGVVYLARDRRLGRDVALKVPKKSRFPSPDHFAKFLGEAQLAAQLKHPNIVTVYDVCDESDAVFMVLEYIPGRTLQEAMGGRPWPPAEAARLLERIADAVAYANQRGLVHRDLKPANVLLDLDGEPHVADFGLAVHEEAQRLADRDSGGTPSYMAPEQVRCETHKLDGRTDLWSLGVILYEMLTGRRPFVGADAEEVYYRILRQDPKPPRQLRPEIPPELEAICLRCLAKPMNDRYSTVADLASALRRWRENGDPVSDSPVSPRRKTPRRTQVWFWVSCLLLIIAASGVLLLAFAAKRNRHGSELTSRPFVELRPDEIQPRKWYPLLDCSPTSVKWPNDGGRSRFLSFPEGRHVWATSIADGLLSVGRVDQGDYTFRVDIHQIGWVGGVGVFWGRHEALDGATNRAVVRYQQLVLQSAPRRDDPAALAFVHSVVTERRDPQGVRNASRRQFPGARVELPSVTPQQLQITVQGGRLQQVRWGGQTLSEIVDRADSPDDNYGEFGLYLYHCTADFWDAEVLLNAHP